MRMPMSFADTHGQEVEAIENVLMSVNVLLREFEECEKKEAESEKKEGGENNKKGKKIIEEEDSEEDSDSDGSVSESEDESEDNEDGEETSRYHAKQAFVTILEDLKNKLIVMIQSCHNEDGLTKLLELNDEIDRVIGLLKKDAVVPEEIPVVTELPVSKPITTTATFLQERDDDSVWSDTSSIPDGASASSHKGKEVFEEIELKEERKKGKMEAKVSCPICDEEFDSWDLVYELDTCKHIYCVDCLQHYYKQKINDGSVLNIACPDPSCKEGVTPRDMRSVLDQQMWEKYNDFALIYLLKQDPNTCWCPSPGCNNAIIRLPNEDPYIACDACRHKFCAVCKAGWHGELTCEQNSKTKETIEKSGEKQARAFNKWTSKRKLNVKLCPRCQAYIQKISGCNHMTCVSCKYQFCWLCLGEYTSTHFSDRARFPKCYKNQRYNPQPWYIQGPKYAGIGAAVLVFGIPVVAIGAPIYGCYKLHQRNKRRRRYRW